MTAFKFLKLSFLAFAATGLVLSGLSLLIRKRLGLLSKVFLAGIAIGIFFYFDVRYIEPNWIQVQRVRIPDKKLSEIVRDVRMIQITDIHLNHGIGFRERELIRKVNRLKPDLIFFTGDLVDDLTQIPAAKQLIKSLHANIGIYGVPGNTDHIVMDSASFKREFESVGMEVLVNETRPIRLPNRKILWLAGVDDPKYNYADLDRALAHIPAGVPYLMLAHSPGIFDDAIQYGPSLILTGDTHGGQVGIPFLVRMSNYANRTPYINGLFHRDRTYMYVNRGIGMKTLYVRFLCRPEIAVLDIEE